MPRPRVICHMAASIDGRVVVDGWPASAAAAVRREYEAVHATFDAEGWICGRITMEPFAKQVRTDADLGTERRPGAPRADFTAKGDFESFAFAIDAHGRLSWQSNDISGDHVVAILSERVSDDYLAFLREREVSYLLAGAREIDLALALDKIGTSFNVRTLMLEGGGRINGSMLQAGLIDEVSVIIAPVADGRAVPSLFDLDAGADRRDANLLSLRSVEKRSGGVLWLRYDVTADSA